MKGLFSVLSRERKHEFKTLYGLSFGLGNSAVKRSSDAISAADSSVGPPRSFMSVAFSSHASTKCRSVASSIGSAPALFQRRCHLQLLSENMWEGCCRRGRSMRRWAAGAGCSPGQRLRVDFAFWCHKGDERKLCLYTGDY